MSASTGLPVVDCAALDTDPTDPALVAAVADACARVGGFVATGCAPATTAQAFTQARRFFTLPEHRRRAVADDRNNRGWTAYRSETSSGARPTSRRRSRWDATWDPTTRWCSCGTPLHGPNQWPDLPGFRPVVERLFDEVLELCRKVSVPLALGLGLDAAALRAQLDEPYASMRLHRYPAVDPEHVGPDEEFGHAPHTDFGALGIVLQEDDGGLQAEWAYRWADVPGGGDRVTVLVGDLLAWWSGGHYRALRHQVPVPRHSDRYSVAAFVNPGFNRTLHPMNDDGAPGERCGNFILNAARARRAAVGAND